MSQDINAHKHTYCLACGEILRYASVMICMECLNDECGDFTKLVLAAAEKTEEDSNDTSGTSI